ncbi:class I SAM-dependent methyltransferase [Bdellovibrionota bacterium FG-2]
MKFTSIKSPAILALVAQLLAVPVVIAFRYLAIELFSVQLGLLQTALLQGAIAAGVGQYFHLPRWWLLINFSFFPLLTALNTASLPRSGFLIGFILLLLLNWNSFKERVPLYLTGKETNRKLVEFLSAHHKDFTFVDLGSGLASTLCFLAGEFPNAKFEGVETAPIVFLLSWFRCLFKKNCKIRYQSLWQVNLVEYHYVYCFLSPEPMPKIWNKAKSEMLKGSVLISNTFTVPGHPPDTIIELHDWRSSKLCIWKL